MARARRREAQRRHVSGGRGRSDRGRHRRARGRRRASGQGAVRADAAPDARRTGDGADRPGGVRDRQRPPGAGAGGGRSGRGLPAGRARRRADVWDARHHPRVPRDAWGGVRVGRRSSHGVGLDAGDQRGARRICAGSEHPRSERPRHHPVHGRRLRQQDGARRARPHLRASGQGGERAGEADARSQGRASRDRQSPVRSRARKSRRRRRDSRSPTSISSRTGAGRTRTFTSTPGSSARCARPAIRKARSSPKC